VLWIQPEVVESTRLTRSSVPAASLAEIDKGKVEPTLDDAHRYIANLDQQATTTVSSTTTSLASVGN